jgi:ketosteroid isomerase-like protein
MSRNGIIGLVAAATAAFVAVISGVRNNAGTSQPQPPGPSTAASIQSSANTQAEVFALENDWTKALVARDTAAFRRLTVPGFVYTEDNVVMTQNELINVIATSPDTVESAANEEMKLYDYTPTAVVTGILVVKARGKGKEYTNRYRFTDIWLNRDGKWQAIAAQDYLIPK